MSDPVGLEASLFDVILPPSCHTPAVKSMSAMKDPLRTLQRRLVTFDYPIRRHSVLGNASFIRENDSGNTLGNR